MYFRYQPDETFCLKDVCEAVFHVDCINTDKALLLPSHSQLVIMNYRDPSETVSVLCHLLSTIYFFLLLIKFC